MILKLLLNTRMLCRMPIKILKSAIQANKRKILIVFDDMMDDLISNKNRN